MEKTLNLLIIEDSPYDAELEIATLEEAGYTCQWTRVESRRELLAALITPTFDLILADYNLPGFDGLTALNLILEHKLDLPFILVSGMLGEETAIESLKAGATDYVLKDRLERLGPVVDRALREKEALQQQKQAEEALRQNEERFRTLIENGLDIITVVDEQGTIHLESPSIKRILGRSATELIQQDLSSFIHPQDFPLAQKLIQECLQEINTIKTMEIRIRHQDESWRTLEVIARNLLDTPSVRGFVINARDITERKQLEEQFDQAQKMEAIGRLAGGIAHDFNNLLVPIIGHAELGLMHLSPSDKLHEHLDQIYKAAQRAADMTRQILSISRRQELETTVVDLNQIVLGLETMLRRLIGEDIEIEMNLDPSLNHIEADNSKISQVLLNLAINARDAMPNGGQLVFQTNNVVLDENHISRQTDIAHGAYVMLSVSDTGHGMDEETRQRLFEPFFTTKEEGKGTGLGLATVHGIIKQHRGHVGVYSEKNRGTTFKIYFPFTEAKPKKDKPLTLSTTVPSNHQTILLVEDEQMVRKLTSDMLKTQGFQVFEAANGVEALHFAQSYEGKIDLLLTDVVMPQMNGQELYTQLIAKRTDLKVLFMSGYVDNILNYHDTIKTGVNFLQKPFTIQALIQQVKGALQ